MCIRDREGAQVALLPGSAHPILPQRRTEFSSGDVRPMTVDQIGQQLLGLRALELQRFSVHKYVEPAESLHPHPFIPSRVFIKECQLCLLYTSS